MTTNVLLIYPTPSVSSPQKSPPLSILHVGEALRAAWRLGESDESYNVQYFDERYDPSPDLDWADVIGVSSMTGYQLKGAIRWLKVAKEKGKRTVLGGIHVTMQPEQCLAEDYVDSIVMSEGEWAIIDAIHGGYKHIAHGHLKDTSDHVSPVSPETLIHFQRSAVTGDTVLMTSRGCPFRCGFATRIDSVISTPTGGIQAKRLVVGDTVLGWDEKNSVVAPTKIVAVNLPIPTEEIEIETETGEVLICSPEHPIMTRRGWVLAGDLQESDEVLVQNSV